MGERTSLKQWQQQRSSQQPPVAVAAGSKAVSAASAVGQKARIAHPADGACYNPAWCRGKRTAALVRDLRLTSVVERVC